MSRRIFLDISAFLATAICVFSAPLAAQEARQSLSSSAGRSRPIDEISVGTTQEVFLDRTRQDASGGVSDYTRFSGRLKIRPSEKSVRGALEVAGSFAANVDRESTIEVPEAFLSWSDRVSPSGFGLTLGRKREAWSALDSTWGLGLWQPLNRFDALRPSEQGMTGAMIDYVNGPFRALVFASTIFVPEQGPPFQLQDGRFESSNPWFSSPTDRLMLFSRETRMRYRLEMPTIGSVINHPSTGAIVRWSEREDGGLFAQASVAKKPRNQLALPYQGHLALAPDSSPKGDVSIFPRVVYHSVVGLDVGRKGEALSFGVSGLAEYADNEAPPAGLTGQRLEPLFLVSPNLEFQSWPGRAWSPRVQLATLHAMGGEQTVLGPDASKDSNPFGSRTMFKQAVSLALKSRIGRMGRWKLEHGLRWIEELAEKGSVVMNDLVLSSPDDWRLGFYADFLGTRQPPEKNPGFISRFRDNDRVGAQLVYVF